MSNFQWPNPRWPPFYRNIAKIAMKQELIDLEWWFWCSNVDILGKGFTSRQQKTCMSNIQGPNPRWPPFYISRSNGQVIIFFGGYLSNIILVIFFRYPWHVTYLLRLFFFLTITLEIIQIQDGRHFIYHSQIGNLKKWGYFSNVILVIFSDIHGI